MAVRSLGLLSSNFLYIGVGTLKYSTLFDSHRPGFNMSQMAYLRDLFVSIY